MLDGVASSTPFGGFRDTSGSGAARLRYLGDVSGVLLPASVAGEAATIEISAESKPSDLPKYMASE